MPAMSWVLGAAVLAALGWIVAIVGGQLGRADRRQQLASAAAQLEAQAVGLDATRPGGAADRPIEVISASQIEPRAQREPCPRCGGRFHVATHEVQVIDDDRPGPGIDADAKRLRHVVCRCGSCGVERPTWFYIRVPTPLA